MWLILALVLLLFVFGVIVVKPLLWLALIMLLVYIVAGVRNSRWY